MPGSGSACSSSRQRTRWPLPLRSGPRWSSSTPGAIATSATQAHALGLEVHAGHGLDFATAAEILVIPEIVELNIGHFLIGEAVFVGLDAAIRRMRTAMDAALSDLDA